jgi:D-glycero-alpha-D-manno-heptose-7-phosphate kinase
MIGSRTPFRMSFIGGGSDLKEFYTRSPGSVLSTTINKYMYIFIHPFFDNRIQVKYSKTELVERIIEIKHPIVREALRKFAIDGIDINSIADIPAGTGLGSSGSYTVGLLHALYSYTNQQVSSELLAKDACEIEIDILK